MALNVSFSLIIYGSKEYSEMVKLRYQILRKPLGLDFTDEYLAQEKSDYLCVCKEKDKTIGACILTPVDNKIIQLRQMAVADNYQGKGIGKKLIDFAEQTAIDHGFNKIILHARKTAVPFYEKLNYSIIGDEFTEVGIAHHEMEKEIYNTMENNNWEIEKKQVLDTVSKYIDITLTPFGKPQRSVIGVEKRDPMYGGNGVVYMLSLFEKGELVNNRIGVYMVLMNKGDQAGFHEHGSKKEQELYVLVHGQGEYIERIGEDNVTRKFDLKKGNVTCIQGDNNYHSIINTGNEPLIIFVVTTYEVR